jgi:transposase-like protein
MDASALKYAFDMYEDIRFNFASRKSVQSAQTKIANGQRVGRPIGKKNSSYILDGKEATILKMYQNKVTMRAISQIMNVSTQTIKRLLVRLNAIPKDCLSKPGYPRGVARPHHVMDGKEQTALQMYENGFSASAIAREIGVSIPTVSKFLVSQNTKDE